MWASNKQGNSYACSATHGISNRKENSIRGGGRNSESRKVETVKDDIGQLLEKSRAVRKSCAEVFKRVLNVKDDRKIRRSIIVDGRRIPVLGEVNDRGMMIEQLHKAVNDLKADNVSGFD